MMNKHAASRLASGVLLFLCMTGPLLAQTATGTVRGTITDPSGALVPQAEISISNAGGFSRELKSGAAGTFEVPRLVPGRYSLSVDAKGFAPAKVDEVLVYAGKVTSEKVKLEISVQSEVQVTAENTGVSVNPEDNASALVIKGKDLDALSDDPDDLQSELTALAGPRLNVSRATSSVRSAKSAPPVSRTTLRTRARAATGFLVIMTTSRHSGTASSSATAAPPTCPVPPSTIAAKFWVMSQRLCHLRIRQHNADSSRTPRPPRRCQCQTE